MEILYISYGEFFKVTCTAVQELYRSSLHGMSIDSHPESCVLIQTASPYSSGKYVNWNLSFFNGDPV